MKGAGGHGCSGTGEWALIDMIMMVLKDVLPETPAGEEREGEEKEVSF